jgi:hypothetical protein
MIVAAAAFFALTASAALGAPELTVEKSNWRMGNIERNQTRTTTVVLKNTGDEPLVISQIRPSCKSCLGKVADGDRIEPGAESRLDVAYEAVGALGEHTVYVTIHSNDPVHPLTRVRFSVKIVPEKDRPALTITPVFVDLGVVAIGDTVTFNVELGNEGDKPLDMHSIIPSSACSTRDDAKDAVAPGAVRSIPVDVTPRVRGVIRESVGFETNDPERPSVIVQIEGYAVEAAEKAASIVITPRKGSTDGELLLYLENTSAVDAILRAAESERGLHAAPGVRLLSPLKTVVGEDGVILLRLVLRPVTESE